MDKGSDTGSEVIDTDTEEVETGTKRPNEF